jgi:F-type H+-transporting ATPase subunit delta
VFHVNRWAAAFAGVAGDKAGDGLACLKALVPAVKTVPGALFGTSGALRLEKMLRESVHATVGGDATAGAGTVFGGTAVEYAIRFIIMMVEKNNFRHIDPVIQKIEKIVDTQNGILEVTAESASPFDDAFEEEFRQQILQRTGAAGIKMSLRVVPELLGGYRLRIGGFYIDASLKGQVEQLTEELTNEQR